MAKRLPPQEIETRRQKALDLRKQGTHWIDIATQLGYSSPGHACGDVMRALARMREATGEAVAEWRDTEIRKLDEYEAITMEALAAKGVHVSVDRDGNVHVTEIDDPDQVLKGVDRLVKIAQRRASLLGLDAPAKVETSGTVRYTVAGVDMSKLS
jgi:hypothetical protein